MSATEVAVLRRTAVLTTKHGKGPTIAAALGRAGLEVSTVACDTDLLGTFSGEVERAEPPLQTAVRKAQLGMASTGCSLGLASEGTFDPDPVVGLHTRNLEVVVLVDDTSATTVIGRASSTATRTFSAVARPGDDLGRLLVGADLPRHAVIVRPNRGPVRPVHKERRTPTEVARAVADCASASPDGYARIETDLRADRCPSRLAVIGAAARDLTERLARRCPACGVAGWGPEEPRVGLPCAWCAAPTLAAYAVREACPGCGHEAERRLGAPDAVADPAQCLLCNP